MDILAGEDHYLLVLIAAADRTPTEKGRWDRVRLILAGLVVVGVCLPFNFFVSSHVQNAFISGLLLNVSVIGMVVLMFWLGNLGHGQPD